MSTVPVAVAAVPAATAVPTAITAIPTASAVPVAVSTVPTRTLVTDVAPRSPCDASGPVSRAIIQTATGSIVVGSSRSSAVAWSVGHRRAISGALRNISATGTGAIVWAVVA
jgi:hypothetical protein